ncbi:MAG: hypothetical protein QM679_06540 [Patulibacter sp.]
MRSTRPFYTALGWVTWAVAKRAIKRKLTGGHGAQRCRKLLCGAVVVGGVGAGAYLAASAGTPERPQSRR